MKKFLSVLLAIVMVFSTVAFAAPAVVSVTDTAVETSVPGEEAASLMGAGYKVQRGINMLTGTKDALTGENYSTYGGIFGTAYSDTTISQSTNPKDSADKVFVFNVPGPAIESRTGDYVNFSVQFGPYQTGGYPALSNYISHPYFYFSFDYMKEVVDESAGYTTDDSAWIMTKSSSSDYSFLHLSNVATPSSGWQHVSKILNLTLKNQETAMDYTDPNNIIFHMYVDNANGTDVNFYYDNMIIAPAYKVTYYNAAGDTVVKEDYIAQDEDGNLLTSFEPVGFVEGGVTYSGWASAVGGTTVTSISLDASNNSDIVLYATEEVDAFDGATIVLSDKLTEVGQTVTAKAALTGDPEMDANYVTWTSSDASVLSANKNKDGTATLKAVKVGSSTVTYTYSKDGVTKTLTKNVVVATAPIDEFSGTSLGIDLDTYEYITLNVTNTNDTEQTVTVRCRVTAPGATKAITVNVEIKVPANVTNKDVYVDLTENASWIGTLDTLNYTRTGIPDGVTVNSTKLWAKLMTDLALKFNTESTFIGTPNSSLNIAAEVDCDLEGVYDKTYTWTTNVTNNCAVITEEADGSLTIFAGENAEGFVTVTAKSNDTSKDVEISRRIFVKTGEDDGSKAVAYTWNFNDTAGTANWYNGGGHHSQSKIEDGALTVIKTVAKLSGASSTTAVGTTSTSGGYALTATSAGSYSESGKNTVEFSITDYPYFCFKAKTTAPGTYSLTGYFTADGVSHSESRAKTASFDLTDEYQTFAFDLTSLANSTELKGKNYGGIMFVNHAESVIDASTISSSNVASSPITYSTYRPVIIDEVFFANYDASDSLEVGVNLTADKTSLTGEGTFTLTSEVFSNRAVTNSEVVYTADSDIVTVFDNGDGTATVTPVGNGTVTITAASVLDESACDSVTLNISGVQTKLVAYDLSMVSLGNSYLCHGYAEWFNKDAYNGWINSTDVIRGMAASEPDLDYYGRIQYYINNNFNCSLKANRYANNQIEIAWKKGLADQSDASNHEGFDYVKAKNAILGAMTAQLAYIESEQTNIITIQLAENAQFGSYGEIASFFYDTVFAAIDEVRPEESVVVVITPFGSNAATNAEITKALEYGFYVANCTDMTDKKWQAWDQYPDFHNPNSSSEFRSHPGDLGMDEIGKRVFAQLETAIPANISADYIYVPESISITGGNTITEAEGTLQLDIVTDPSENSVKDVTWSVDNENVATIDENGIVTAVNNGTVNVTAVCAYDEEVKDTITVTVTGQVPAYTVTYASGTTDTVTNLPAADAYAKGTYTLSASAPERNGYKFLGWSLTEGGEVVKTVEMTENKTVYAAWTLAYEWNFDTEGDMEGISFGGFHTYVRYEELPDMVVGTVTSYGDGVTVFDNTLLLDSESYNEFVVRLQPTQATESDTLDLTITSTDGTYNYSVPMTKTSMEEYVFDISNVTGTITGLLLEPSVVELSLYVDYMKFQSDITIIELSENTTSELVIERDTKIIAGDYTFYATNDVVVPEGVTLYLEKGTYSFKNLTGNVVASPYANILILSENVPEDYVEIFLGLKENEDNVRYAEIDGKQFVVPDEYYGVITSEDILIQVVEKSGDEVVSAQYYHVSAQDASYTELTSLEDYMNNVSGQELRMPDEKIDSVGMRFKAQITTASKSEETECQIEEYGYIIGHESNLLANGEELNLNASKYVLGKAYVRGSIDKVFDSSVDEYHIFTAVLYGVPEEHYDNNFVVKTYTKVTVDSKEYVVYGEQMVASFYDIAKALENSDSLTEDAKALVEDIISKTENSTDIVS